MRTYRAFHETLTFSRGAGHSLRKAPRKGNRALRLPSRSPRKRRTERRSPCPDKWVRFGKRCRHSNPLAIGKLNPMEKLTQLNTRVDALLSALRGSQAETVQLRKALEESRAAGVEKDERIRTLMLAGEDKDLQVLTLEEDISKKDAQVEQLIARIEQVLSTLPQSPEPKDA